MRRSRGEVSEEVLFGRGAVDMKGALACALAATFDYLSTHDGRPKGSISFLITGDEEGVAVNGTVKLLKWAADRGEKFDHCLLGEPSNPNALSDMIKIGRRGSLNGTLVVTGTQGHVAYPQLADNPVRGIVALLSALMSAPLDDGSTHFDPSNLEFTSIDVGNKTVNVIPSEARARFNIRYNDRHTQDEVKALIEQRTKAAAGAIRWRIEWEPSNADVFRDRARRVRRPGARRGRRRHRQEPGALDLGRHVGRAFHQGLLPGSRIRARQYHHAQDRRAGPDRRSRDVDRDLPQGFGTVLRVGWLERSETHRLLSPL